MCGNKFLSIIKFRIFKSTQGGKLQVRLGIYSRQLVFFIVLILVSIGLYFAITNNLIFGSIRDVVDLSYSRGTYNMQMTVMPNGKVQVGNKVDDAIISPSEDYDLFKYVVFSQEGIYANELNVTVDLPKTISSLNEVTPRVYAVHGVGETKIKLQNPQEIVFSAYDLAPGSTFTIELQLPKGYVELPWYKELFFGLKNLPLYFWILISVIPLILTLVILFYSYHKTSNDWHGIKTNKIQQNVPDNLTPAEAGALFYGKISSRSIAASFVSMAQRGVIQIVDRENYFTFLRSGNATNVLNNYEKLLLDETFVEEKRNASIEDVNMHIAGHIFSRKIAQAYLEIYNNLYEKGYFLQDPNKFQSGYKRVGYIMFFVGIAGFAANIIAAGAINYFLLIWFSIIVASTFIVKISPHLPIKSKSGFLVSQELYAYKNYLTSKEPYEFSYNAQAIYEKNLPYAIALGCEREWTMRFIRYPFQLPSWIITDRRAIVIEDVLKEVVPFIDFVSYRLASVKEPTI